MSMHMRFRIWDLRWYVIWDEMRWDLRFKIWDERKEEKRKEKGNERKEKKRQWKRGCYCD